MSVPTCTFDGLNLNDGAIYKLMPGVVLGARAKTWDEYRSYTGAVTRANVSEAAYVEMHFPMLVQGSSPADLDAKVQAINTKIDSCSAASPKNLVYEGTTYQIVDTPRVAYDIGQRERNVFCTLLDVLLWRVP